MPDTIDIWPCLALLFSILFSTGCLVAQRRTVTRLSTPLTVTDTLPELRHMRSAVGVMVGELIAWTSILALFIVVLRFSNQFLDNYVDRETVSHCPTYTLSHPATLEYYCNGTYVAIANLEIAGGCFLVMSVGCHMVLFTMACWEVHRRRRTSAGSSSENGNFELQQGRVADEENMLEEETVGRQLKQ